MTTNYVYDGLNPVQEKNGATVTANLLTGLGIDEFLIRMDGSGTKTLLTDGLGSTVALDDGTGTLPSQYTYEPFGYATNLGQASTNSYKYTGREDDGTGLYYYRTRYYHPRLQRFISEDPIGFGGGDPNLYAYVRNNPGSYIDPLGLAELNPNGTIPGGPWTPAGPGQRSGDFYGPKKPGGRDMCRWVPPDGEGGPPGSEGYWKTKTPKGEWQRYDQTGNPITPEEAHPGNRPAPEPIPPLRGLQPLFIFPWQIPSILNPGGGGQVPPA